MNKLNPQTFFSIIFFALISLQIQGQTTWLHLERLPDNLIEVYGKDSLTQLLSQQIIKKQNDYTLELDGYKDDIRLATSKQPSSYNNDFNLRLWLNDTTLSFKTMIYIKYAFFEKDSLIISFRIPMAFNEANPSKTLGLITGMARIVMNTSISKTVNTTTKNLSLPQADSLRVAQKNFYHVIVDYKIGKQMPVADKNLIQNMIQNQWNQTQSKMRKRFNRYFNIYFWDKNTSSKTKKLLLKKLPNFIKITYGLKTLPGKKSYMIRTYAP